MCIARQVQDEAAGLVVSLVDPQPGEYILDACAAPGGKTLFMAARMKNEVCPPPTPFHPSRPAPGRAPHCSCTRTRSRTRTRTHAEPESRVLVSSCVPAAAVHCSSDARGCCEDETLPCSCTEVVLREHNAACVVQHLMRVWSGRGPQSAQAGTALSSFV